MSSVQVVAVHKQKVAPTCITERQVEAGVAVMVVVVIVVVGVVVVVMLWRGWLEGHIKDSVGG